MNLSLAEHLERLIAHDGPQPVSILMELALAHPREGYYSAHPALGAEGDFITAPLTSQMFGEVLGAFALQTWIDLGSPREWHIIELGPGTGALTEDLIRTLKLRPQALDASRFHLIETSRWLEALQRERLSTRARVEWHSSFEDAPEAPFVLIANEFFDVLSTRQFSRRSGIWFERRVARGVDGFEFVSVATNFPVAAEIPEAASAPDGRIIEMSGSARAQARLIAERLLRAPGRALIIDYGYSGENHGDTLQAIERHQKVPVLTSLGTADLSTHVDFGALAREAITMGASAFGPLSQGEFLRRLGIVARHDALAARASTAMRETLARQLHRLTAPDAMGDLFKVLALASPDLPIPPGFEPSDG